MLRLWRAEGSVASTAVGASCESKSARGEKGRVSAASEACKCRLGRLQGQLRTSVLVRSASGSNFHVRGAAWSCTFHSASRL